MLQFVKINIWKLLKRSCDCCHFVCLVVCDVVNKASTWGRSIMSQANLFLLFLGTVTNMAAPQGSQIQSQKELLLCKYWGGEAIQTLQMEIFAHFLHFQASVCFHSVQVLLPVTFHTGPVQVNIICWLSAFLFINRCQYPLCHCLIPFFHKEKKCGFWSKVISCNMPTVFSCACRHMHVCIHVWVHACVCECVCVCVHVCVCVCSERGECLLLPSGQINIKRAVSTMWR